MRNSPMCRQVQRQEAVLISMASSRRVGSDKSTNDLRCRSSGTSSMQGQSTAFRVDSASSRIGIEQGIDNLNGHLVPLGSDQNTSFVGSHGDGDWRLISSSDIIRLLGGGLRSSVIFFGMYGGHVCHCRFGRRLANGSRCIGQTSRSGEGSLGRRWSVGRGRRSSERGVVVGAGRTRSKGDEMQGETAVSGFSLRSCLWV